MDDVQHDGGAFFIARDGKRVAVMTYSREPGGKSVSFDHTEVDPSLRGGGVAKKLVAAAVDWARAEKLRVRPLCPYAKAVIDRTPEFQDVVRR